jgi:hypothetical protein
MPVEESDDDLSDYELEVEFDRDEEDVEDHNDNGRAGASTGKQVRPGKGLNPAQKVS